MVKCELCGCHVKHGLGELYRLKRHQQTKKCAKLAAERMYLFEEFCRECEDTLPRVKGFTDWKSLTKALPEEVQELIDYHTFGKQAQEAKKAVMVSIDNCVCAINNHTTVENSPLDHLVDSVDTLPNFMKCVLPSYGQVIEDWCKHGTANFSSLGFWNDDIYNDVDDAMYGEMNWYRAFPYFFKSRIEATFPDIEVKISPNPNAKNRPMIQTITETGNDMVLWDAYEGSPWDRAEHFDCYALGSCHRLLIRMINNLVEPLSIKFIRRFQR